MEIASLRSLKNSDLVQVLERFSPKDQRMILAQLDPTLAADFRVTSEGDERETQAARMSAKRARLRDLTIPIPEDINRRNDSLQDPQLFFTTYFASTFFEEFTSDRAAMLEAILYAAQYGGDHAIAGPRGEGKTRLAMYGSIYLMMKGLSNFPCVIGKSQGKSQNELMTIRERLQQNPLLIADFPEIGVPFQAVGGWSSRCRMQTVAGCYTNIGLAADHIAFPTITREMLPDEWPDECESVANGQIFAALGIDGPIRGTNYRDARPTLGLIDDIESRESAKSDALIASNEDIIEKDVGGLGTGRRRVSRVMLCTTQNRKCIAFKYTDPAQKPSWNGKRYRKMIMKPDRMDLWQKYVEMRELRGTDDPDAREAFRFYRDNKEAMDFGCIVSNVHSFDATEHPDKEPMELSAIQAYFNRVADLGAEAVATEDDNDPPKEEGPESSGLTVSLVSSRISGLARLQAPANTICITAGIDLGKYSCHWVLVAWFKGGGGCVLDYGVAEVPGTSPEMTKESSEPNIYRTLIKWREEILGTKIVDLTGATRTIDSIFVDSGDFTDAAYEFVRKVGGNPFFATKGMVPYREPRTDNTQKVDVGFHIHGRYQPHQKLWLIHLDTDYWKKWIHERFLTPPLDEKNQFNPGSLSLFAPLGSRRHIVFPQHICAEEWVKEFTEGKGEKTYWICHNKNNHYLDAIYNAAAAASMKGVRLLSEVVKMQPTEVSQAIAQKEARIPKKKRAPMQRTSPYQTRNGGWIQGARR